jgi:agmatine deiminase
MNKFFTTVFLILFSLQAFTQMLPRWLTEDEKLQMPAYLNSFNQKKASTPPNFDVRNMAEWEEAEYLVVTWAGYNSILREIIRYGREEAKVIVVCSDSNSVKAYLQNGNVSLNNVSYLQENFNSIWIRDYFGNTGYKNDVDSLVMVDWIYNRPRPGDDKVAHKVSSLLNIPLYETAVNPNRLVHTGGNYMSDGLGLGFSSNLVLDENPTKSKADVDGIMNGYLGVSKYVNMTNLPYDDIHHIDMHMKLMNENTLLVGEYPIGISDGPQIEANINYVLSNYSASNGEPFNIERIEMPNGNSGGWPSQGGNYYTYANMLFVNNTILVPVYNLSTDAAALETIRGLMPGYRVVGIDCSSIIPQGGAIHCITHTIGVKNPLVINHYPIANQEENGNDYLITASAKHISGINQMNLYWTTDTTQPLNSISMGVSLSGNLEYEATIPNQPAGTTVYYYIEAEAQSGKKGTRPMPAPKGFYSFEVMPFTGIDQLEKDLSTGRVFPNPAKAITAIELNGEINQPVNLKIFDSLGKMVFQKTEIPFGVGNSKSQLFFDVSNFSKGVYWVEVGFGDIVKSHQLIVE